MADNEVTLLLGEQMAVVFLGVNVVFPLTFSALLAAIVLAIVQTSRFVKRVMGRASSKEINNDLDDIQQASEKTPVQSIESNESDVVKEDGHPVVRKRRSSLVHQIDSSFNSSPPDRSTIRTSSPNSPSPSSQFSIRSTDSSTPFRKHRIGSGNRVSPITPPSETQDKKQTISWAWMDQTSQNKEERRIINRKHPERVVSPSQCQIQTISTEESARKSAGIFCDEEMKAYDIW